MGWELRHGDKLYLYRNRRINGKPVKEYLAAAQRLSLGDLYAQWLLELQEGQRHLRELKQQAGQRFRTRINSIIQESEQASHDLRIVSDGLLYSLGYHKHNRGEWRMRHEIQQLTEAVKRLQAQKDKPGPLVAYSAPNDDTEAVALFEKALSGDSEAQALISQLIRDRDWIDWIGDLGRQTTRQMIHNTAGGDPVWKEGITQKAIALRDELLEPNPSVLEELLVRRVLNGWIALHALELEQTVRPSAERRDREYLDKALSRAERRYMQVIGELARVRKLQVPTILARMVD